MRTNKLSLDVETQEANLLKLLAHPVRIAILKILHQEEACVCHMEATLGYRQAYLSQQLAVLREAGIISDRRDGWNIFYQIQDPQVFDILDISAKFLHSGSSEIPLKPVNCPCPKCTSTQNKGSCSNQTKKEKINVND
ncbi:MAG: ArsR family transcriptional regulator [Chloroflexi bacterium HGW-Chloroflexi-2]|jgi:ArsR family transcriptional regulator|nr:MAG: ArsR family transcriptional regulator [Chloroflexi bacterium HGW-Chloroflexi-2]